MQEIHSYTVRQSKLAGDVTNVTCIWDIPESNLGQDYVSPEVFRSFPHYPQVCPESTFNQVTTASFNSFYSYCYSLLPNHSTVGSLSHNSVVKHTITKQYIESCEFIRRAPKFVLTDTKVC
jgi:hypothetical protein